MSAPNSPHDAPETTTLEIADPVLVSRTATDYSAHRLDAIPYVGNYQPKYLLVIWALYFAWCSWYMVAHYLPDYQLWFSGSKALQEVIYGGYDQDYWDTHVEDTDEDGFLKKLNIPEKMKKLQGTAPASKPEGEAGADAQAAPAEEAAGGGGMSFPGAVPAEGVKVETGDM